MTTERRFYDPDQAMFCDGAATAQNGLDLADGTWVTNFKHLNVRTSGAAVLYPDPRLNWLARHYGDLTGKSVLELGSFEGAHTLQYESLGCASVTGVEANEAHFLKSLLIKNAARSKNTQFLLGDFAKYLEACDQHYDLVSACGVLYHMTDPGAIIRDAARVSKDGIFIWTVLFDPEYTPQGHQNLVTGVETVENGDLAYRGHKHYYRSVDPKAAKKDKNFSGGLDRYALWLEEDELIRILKHYGFSQIAKEVRLDNPGHGKDMLLFARKA
ncbi:MAG: methyltransferase domain-containing protein [Pseudomonadota bacterium]